MSQSPFWTPIDTEALAVRIIQAVSSRPLPVGGHLVHLGVSVGIARAPQDGDDPAELMSHADLALYAAKAAGKATFRHYDVLLDDKMRHRQALEAGLRSALEDERLELHYQPLVDARTGRITAVEALVRWNHPERGLIPPIDFIDIAEDTGLILPLGRWVLETACTEAASWPEHMNVAANLSPA